MLRAISQSSGNESVYGGIVDDEYGTQIARHKGGYDISPSGWDVNEFGELRTPNSASAFYADEAEESLLGHGPAPSAVPDNEQNEESDDSDIDLHTPLPHILLREGVLSPHSKLLSASRSSLFSDVAFGGARESIVSTATDGECAA